MRRNPVIGALAVGVAMLLAGPGCGQRPTPAARTNPAERAAREWVTPAVQAPRVQHRTFRSEAADRPISYHIFVPAPYDAMPDRRFPVLYWLHGGGGGLAGIARLSRDFAGAMREGRMPVMLVVFPNGLAGSLWVDSKDGSVPMETIVVEELIPHIDAEFRTVADRGGRIVEGFSMGGYGAARFGFEHHELFGAVSILAGGPLQQELTESPRMPAARRAQVFRQVFGGDMDYFRALSPWVLAETNADVLAARTRIRLVIGERDEMLEVNRRFHEHLTALGVPHEFVVVPGVGHSAMPLRGALGDDGWAFYRAGADR